MVTALVLAPVFAPAVLVLLPPVAEAPPSVLPPLLEVAPPRVLPPLLEFAPPKVLPPLVELLAPVDALLAPVESVEVLLFPVEELVLVPPLLVVVPPLLVVVPPVLFVLPPVIVPVVVLVEFCSTLGLTVGLIVTPDEFEAEDVPLWLLVLMVPVADEGVEVLPTVWLVTEQEVEVVGHVVGGVCAAAGSASASALIAAAGRSVPRRPLAQRPVCKKLRRDAPVV
ncbi:MAG: hypothetical protein ABIT04_00885 [Novosphingobium sp.]